MLPSMKFYVVSIVAIFTALGLGIYIGFAMDTEDFITERQESLIDIVESNFETITEENKELISINEELRLQDKNKSSFIDESYEYIVPERLSGLKVAIIESNPDYVISGIGRDLELAGANVLNITTLNKRVQDSKNYKSIINEVTKSIIMGNDLERINELTDQGYIDTLGDYSSNVDMVIVSGGSYDGNSNSLLLDREIIDVCKKENISLLGVEKSSVNNSYIGKYKEYNIPTVDNVETKMGKVAMVLSLEGKKGHFGIKGTADSVLPIR